MLGDGDTKPTSPALIGDMVAHGISVSAVGVDIDGQPPNMAAMRAIAEAGHGRFYQSESPSQVPDILLKESNDELKPWIVEEPFVPALGSPSAALAGLDLAGLPGVGGYVASTPKAAAEVALRGPMRDPLLAQWRYGLGRSAVWTSDTEGRWSGDLLAWRQGPKLLAGIVASTMPLAADPALTISAAVRPDGLHVTAQVGDATPDTAVTADVVPPDRRGSEVALASTGPGRFEADVPADQVGSYLMRVSATSHGRIEHGATVGAVVPYSPEYRFVGTDLGFLRAVASAGGGMVSRDLGAISRAPVPEVRTTVSLAIAMLVVATLLLPVDVAVRRLTFRAGDAAAWREAVRRDHRAEVESDPLLGRLRDRVERVRAERSGRRRDAPDAAPPPDEPEDLAGRLRERLGRR